MIAQELEVSLHMAFVEARQKRHEFITVEHLLLALLDNPTAAEVLQLFFTLTRERATQIMLKVHTEGRGVCGIFPKDVASTKVEQVTAYSRQHQHPLQCAMEET